jgi:hypothetical protein
VEGRGEDAGRATRAPRLGALARDEPRLRLGARREHGDHHRVPAPAARALARPSGAATTIS